MSQKDPKQTSEAEKQEAKKSRKSPPPYEPPRLVKFDQLEKLIVSGE